MGKGGERSWGGGGKDLGGKGKRGLITGWGGKDFRGKVGKDLRGEEGKMGKDLRGEKGEKV